MDKLPMCRICLAENVHMYVVVNKTLHDLYEKLTDNPFVTEDGRPILACFICCAQLKKCYRLLKKCLEAEEMFAKMLMINVEYERKTLINQDQFELFHGFIRTPTKIISIVDVDQTESIVVKEELPAVCESDSEDDVPLIDIKTEVEEQGLSNRKRKSKKTYNGETSPIRAYSNEEFTQCLQDMMDDAEFNDRNDPLSTFIPEVVPERRLPKETVGSVTEETEIISKGELTCNGNSSLVPIHEDPCGNEFCDGLEAYAIRTDDVRNLPTNVSSKDSIKKTDVRQKRLIHKQHWIDVQRKKLKNEGKSFTNKRGKLIKEKVLGQPCGKTCRYKCTENYDLKQRKNIFSNFWGLGDRHKHWEFVIKYTKKINKMRRTTEITKHNREYTYVYYLPSSKMERKRVCKQMFLNTISCSDRIISTAWKKFDGLTSVQEDHRGKYDHTLKPRVKLCELFT